MTTLMVCASCGKNIADDEVTWTLIRGERTSPDRTCPKCGKNFKVMNNPVRSQLEIKKNCTCDLVLSFASIEDATPKLQKKFFAYCDKCAQSIFPKVLFKVV